MDYNQQQICHTTYLCEYGFGFDQVSLLISDTLLDFNLVRCAITRDGGLTVRRNGLGSITSLIITLEITHPNNIFHYDEG